MAATGVLGGGSAGYSTSSSAPSAAYGGASTAGDSTFGDFNFKSDSASGAASVGGVSPLLLVGGAVVVLLAWIALRK